MRPIRSQHAERAKSSYKRGSTFGNMRAFDLVPLLELIRDDVERIGKFNQGISMHDVAHFQAHHGPVSPCAARPM